MASHGGDDNALPRANEGESIIKVVQNDDDLGLMDVESMCMNCHNNGSTKFLLIKIPFFRDVLLESFDCPHCNFKNNSIKAAGEIQEHGTKYTLEIHDKRDFDRQVVKGDSSIFRLETLGIEMPAGEGQLTNIEGMLTKIQTQLESEQPQRKIADPALFQALEDILQRLAKMISGETFPFTVTLEDATGNSWISPAPYDEGNRYKRQEFQRTKEQNEALGIGIGGENEGPAAVLSTGDPNDLDIVDGNMYSLPTNCPGCMKPCVVNMQKVNIPHFKEVFIWGTVCDHCGYRTSDVKTGGAIPEKGKRIKLRVETIEDLSRDILKSETCVLKSDDLGLSVQPGTLGGRFTTVEGLLTQIRDQLHEQIFDFGDEDLAPGDSMALSEKERWEQFFSKIDAAIKGDKKFTIILEDPCANSYVQNLYLPEPDPQLEEEDYTRTEEEEEDLGLKDMKTEGYEEDHQLALEAEKVKKAEEES
ncbi:nucleolar zinc-finger protein [Microsporum canis]|uniref:Zinc finger protein zpr1 n=1 Tax=Arthroderma otae (strain ATCC MYA-4605 / CBS 113480) TaxID=554155 RepID=C5FK59_ARTOC|nr:zinc finger protein zpr1 [Microsporum canis CBS 113480]EEQ30081.1 zinc finger protein zpr1 [Microsporum canis CBS 113480]